MVKKKDRPRYYSTILRLGEHLYHNAHNLLVDACILYRAKSFPTAFALAVLAYEELGKMEMILDVGSETWLWPNPGRDECLDRLFSRERAYNHVAKQRAALWARWYAGGRAYSEKYLNGHLDRLKQACFYVGFHNGRIMPPDRISARTAYNQINRVVKLSRQFGDAAFRSYDNKSTARTLATAEKYNTKAAANLKLLRRPRQAAHS